MKILVIFTGGTIGSTLEDGWITPNESTRYALIDTFEQQYGQEVVLETYAPYTILSENLSAKTLTLLTEVVHTALNRDYDGIIVTHGTDTLQFSAAALAYATGNDCIPTVLVSANYPLGDKRSNGNANFRAAVEFIKNGCGRGVFIAYKNEGNAVTFHQALAAVSHLEASDALFSMYDKIYARETENGIEVLGHIQLCEKLPVKFAEDPGILVVGIHPGDGYAYAIEKYTAVILRPYHSGTLNTDSHAFITFCNRAKALGIPLYVVNITGGAAYASAKTYENLGIIPLGDTSFAAAYVRLWMDLSR